MTFEYPIPPETAAIYKSYQRRVQNPGLVFERFIGYDGTDWSLEPRQEGRQSVNPKFQNLRQVSQLDFDANLLQAVSERWQAMTTAYEATTFPAITDWHFVTGMGNKGALEVGFRFHHLYGIPIIPGSGLKGLTAAFAQLVLQLKETDDEFKNVFGTQEQVGSAIFFDAIPLGLPKLALDVMNPHYPEYYQNPQHPKAPTNWQKLIPIPFLTVGRQCLFQFAIGGRGKKGNDAKEAACKWLIAALEKMGAGAKTAAGYGYFSKVSSEQADQARRKLSQAVAATTKAQTAAKSAALPKAESSKKPATVSASLPPMQASPPPQPKAVIAKGDKLRAKVISFAAGKGEVEMIEKDAGRKLPLTSTLFLRAGSIIEVRVLAVANNGAQITKVEFAKLVKSA